MNAEQYDLNDVAKAGSNLQSLGCTASGTYLPDSVMQVKFSSVISNYVNEVIRDVNQGVISAWEGMQELKNEYDELASTLWFYAKNGGGVAGGFMQVKTGAEVLVTTRGLGAPYGGPMIAHGYNNIHEGVLNIYNGNNNAVGPVREFYRDRLKDDSSGDMAYYSIDLVLAGVGLGRNVPKEGRFKLFRNIADDYERAYKQAGKISLALEAFIDGVSIQSIFTLNADQEARN